MLILPEAIVWAAGGDAAAVREPDVVRGATVDAPAAPRVFDGDLRDLPRGDAVPPGRILREVPRLATGPAAAAGRGRPPSPDWPSLDPLLEFGSEASGARALAMPAPILNFDGLPFSGSVPPDTVGDVGPNHYVQMVNGGTVGSGVSVYDKSGTLLAGPFALESLWTGGGPCSTGLGDPVVLYDTLADRWLMSEFAATGNRLCVYISQTDDPLSGGWFLYSFATPDFPDYPKYGVWPDAYYVSTNEGDPAAYAMDRQQMLVGGAATMQRFAAPRLAGFPFQALVPADLDGADPPPLGAPNYFMRHRDDEVHNPVNADPTQDFLEIWELSVDFINPANSTFTGPFDVPVAEFDSRLCGLSTLNCIPQPGTGTRLDPLREVVMWRLAYRNFGVHEALVGNFAVDVDATDHAGIRWFELRKSGAGAWSLHQEGTHAPDQDHRWMGSIAMDGDGNIALGYSVSSGTLFPSIRYAGRLGGDPLGLLAQGEATLVAGGGSQTGTNRWGDYSAMSVDPADDCTFWYTNEYYPVTASAGWQTRIGTFAFPSCGGAAPEVTLTDGAVTRGVLLAGSLSSLTASDDDALLVQAIPNASQTRFQATIGVDAVSSLTAVSRLDLRLETSADAGGVRTSVLLRNFDTGRLDRIGTIRQSQSDSLRDFLDLANPNAYIDDVTGGLELQLRSSSRASQTPLGFAIGVDEVRFSVTP